MTRLLSLPQLLLSIAVALLGFGNLPAQKHVKCDLQAQYGLIFSAHRFVQGDFKTVLTEVESVPEGHCLAPLVNGNQMYLNYLLKHCTNLDYDALKAVADDSIRLQKDFVHQLERSDDFNGMLSAFAARFLDPRLPPKDTLTMDKVLDVAVKFFSISKITPEGYYAGKVCVGINGIQSTQKERQFQIEAFCFAAVFDNYQSPAYNLLAEFTKALKELYKVQLGLDEKERLLRAQGGMFFLMRNNAPLRAALLHEYELRAAYLPFVIQS